MRSFFACASFAVLSGCSTPGPMSGVAGGTGLTLGKADACRAFREALLAREHLIAISDPSNAEQPIFEGIATFKKHEKFADTFAYRTIRDSIGDPYDRHVFQLVAGDGKACRYVHFDDESQSHLEFELRREGDDIVAGQPNQRGGFRLSPNVDGMGGRRRK